MYWNCAVTKITKAVDTNKMFIKSFIEIDRFIND